MNSVSRNYLPSLTRMARSAEKYGQFRCVVVYAQEDFPELCNTLLLPILVPAAPLPEDTFCSSDMGIEAPLKNLWGWRRTMFHKTFGLLALLERGFDVLLVDADWTFKH